MVRTRCYRDGVLVAAGFPIAEVSDHLAEPRSVVWFDLYRPDTSDLEAIQDELRLHALAVENAVPRPPRQSGQRPKLDHYPEHLFLVTYALSVDAETRELRKHPVSAFLTRTAMVTVRADDSFDIDAVVARWDAQPELAASGVAFLLYGLLDYVVDSHFEAVQALDDDTEELEDRLFDEITSDVSLQRRTFELRKSLVAMRRLVLPMREVVNSLLRRDLDIVDAHMTPYYQDVYDHVLRVSDWTDSLRDMQANILETRLTIRSNRLNVITKKVTSWAAIIAVPTAVTGFYGQNIPYPGFQETAGFWTSTAIIAVLAGGLYVAFRAKDWL
jgi:magnesium transporter